MKTGKIKIDERTSSLLAAIAEAEDDPLVIARLAQVDPAEFREFISQYVEVDQEEAIALLEAAKSLAEDRTTQENVGRYRHVSGGDFLTRLTIRGAVAQRISPFRLLLMLQLGLAVSLIYGLWGSALLSYLGGRSEGQSFFAAYTSLFKTIFSLGLILGTALVAFRIQNLIPETIESTLKGRLPGDYYYYKRRFASLRLSTAFSLEFMVVGFIIFSYCQFPLHQRGETLMLIAACAEYALGAYVVRKLTYSVGMIHSLTTAAVTRNLFRKRELDAIDQYVQVVSMLAAICVCVHTIVYYRGPFLYGSIAGQSIRAFLLLPALVAIPSLFTVHFYPRVVLRELYSQSISLEVRRLKKALQEEELGLSEKRHYLIEFDKMSRNELRSNLGFTLSDLVMVLTILIMVQVLLLRL